MTLETERLILRPWKEWDAEDLYKYAQSPEVWPAAWWMPHTSIENSREIIQKILSAPETYAMLHKKDKSTIGSISLMRWNQSWLKVTDTEAELGFWLWVPYWWQWLMPEAAKEMLRHWFEDLKVDKVRCAYYKGNKKSKRVQEKLWFKYKETQDNIYCPFVNETRTRIVQCMTKEERENQK